MRFTSSSKLSLGKLSSEEVSLFTSFPDSFQNFYRTQNGGEVEDPRCVFRTPIVSKMNPKTPVRQTGSIEEFWTFATYKKDPPRDSVPSILHEHYDRHTREEFLPRNVYVFARCRSDSLLSISLNKSDFGSIHYWEYYWRYPWFEDFFSARTKAAKRAFPDYDKIVKTPETPRWWELFDALNYASLVKVGDSFEEFLKNLENEDPL